MRISPWLLLFCVAAAAGLVFAGQSTYDFVQHLDRDVHAITCGYFPGLSAPDASGATGCHKTLMSPYSSVLRSTLWGGLPISLPAMGVFAFLLFRGLDLAFNRADDERAPRIFLVAAAALPVLTSLVFGYIALVELDAACKMCIGIYVSSFVAFAAAIAELLTSRPALGAELGLADAGQAPDDASPVRAHALSFAQGVGFVVIPALIYAGTMPSYDKYVGACGELSKPGDPNGVMIDLDERDAGRASIEVFDPLCSSCRSMEARLEASGLAEQLDRKGVLFPLDSACNWMSDATHPGACAVSEAVLCAGKDAPAVIAWSFERQSEIMAAEKAAVGSAAAMVGEAFPNLKACVGSNAVKARLNKSMRWVVSNQLPVLTPQLFVDGTKLCDADTDIGIDYALSRLIARAPSAAAGEER